MRGFFNAEKNIIESIDRVNAGLKLRNEILADKKGADLSFKKALLDESKALQEIKSKTEELNKSYRSAVKDLQALRDATKQEAQAKKEGTNATLAELKIRKEAAAASQVEARLKREMLEVGSAELRQDKELANAVAAEARARKELITIAQAEARAKKEIANAASAEERAKKDAISTQSAAITLKQKLEGLDKREQQRLLAAASLYKKVEQGLNSLRLRYNELAIKKEMGVELSAREEIRMAGLERTMKRYDAALKSVDASGGRYNRNVGNYASGFNSMNNSVSQLAREMPAFANSVQTGFMALSNNIPIFFDSISQAVAKNKELAAEGKKGVPIWKQLGGAIFSFSTLLSVGVVLLTVYGKDMVAWAQKVISGSDAAAAASKNIKDLNDAKKEGAKSAATEINQLNILYRVSTNTALSTEQRMRAVRKLQDQYPSYFANMSAEQIMLGKAANQYKSLTAAILASARAKAIEGKLQERTETQLSKEEELNQRLNKAIQRGADLKNSGRTETEYVRETGGGNVLKEVSNAELLSREYFKINQLFREKKKLNKSFYDENRFLIDQAAKYQQDAAPYESDKFGKDAPKVRAAKGPTSSISKEQKDYLDSLAAIRDTEIAIARERQLNGEINEKQFQERNIEIIKEYRQKIADYLKGENGRIRAIEASARKRAVEEIIKSNNEIYEYEKDNLDARFKLKKSTLENQADEIERDEYILETERIARLSKNYDEMIVETDLYYQNLIESAKRNAKETINIELERDSEIAKIQGKQSTVVSKTPEAVKTDEEYAQKISEYYKNAANSEERRNILANSKLSISQKEYLIAMAENRQETEALETQKFRNEERVKELQLLEESGKITKEQSLELAKTVDDLGTINEQLEIQAQRKKQMESEKIINDLQPVADMITVGFQVLGLDQTAAEFDSFYRTILDKNATFEEKLKESLELVGAFASDLINKEKNERIAALDEQLARSQETTEQEIEFINGRLERLNALDELSKEQIEERNALEDEARVYKEQQFQREKMIEAQKARAMQKANAQQTIIAGIQGAVMAYLSQLVPGDPTSPIRGSIAAAATLAFAGVNAALIMSKKPVPEYFVGRKSGKAETAWTQEKGREIIASRDGKIKSLGSDSGPVLTKLAEGDKVYTASESMKLLKSIPDINVGAHIHKIDNSKLSPIVINQGNIDYDKLADKIGDKFERVSKKYDKVSYFEDEDGNVFKQEGGKIPVWKGKKRDKKTIIVKPVKNERN